MEIGQIRFHVFGANGGIPLSVNADNSLKDLLSKTNLLGGPNRGGSDWALVVDVNRSALKSIKALGFEPERSILIRNEPEIVCPLNYSKRVSKKFACIIDVGREGEDSSYSTPWPQSWPAPSGEHSLVAGRLTRPVIINANKLSMIKGELYSLRREVINANLVDVYGPKWGSGLNHRLRTLLGETLIALFARRLPHFRALKLWFAKHPSDQGVCFDKHETLRGYRTAIVIENDKTYMSEKLFDAFFAQTVPIYVGPPLSNYGIPPELVITAQPNLKDIKLAIEKSLELDYESWKSELDKFLERSEIRETWEAHRVHHRLLEFIFDFTAKN